MKQNKQMSNKSINSLWINWANTVNKKISWDQHIFIIVIGVIIALILFGTITYFFPLKFSLPPTSVVNWYTIHHYPKQQDYFYFVSGVGFSVLFSFLFWITVICLKIKK